MPHLEALQSGYSDRGIEIVIIDASNRKELTQQIVTEDSLALPMLLDDQDVSGEAYGVFATPTTLVIDPVGRIIFRHIGFGEGMDKMLEQEVSLLLERSAT